MPACLSGAPISPLFTARHQSLHSTLSDNTIPLKYDLLADTSLDLSLIMGHNSGDKGGPVMLQTKVSLKDTHIEFLQNFQKLGFKDKSEMMRAALDRLKKEILEQQLRESAELYAEAYETDSDLQELTESAVSEWPE